MINVASFELCRELYKLSGWDESHLKYTNFYYAGKNGKKRLDRWKLKHSRTETDGELIIPAYDLGFLLRKLPKFVDRAEFWMTNDVLAWTAGYATDKYANGNFHFTRSETADTPEDAATKLAIQLFKEGVLKP